MPRQGAPPARRPRAIGDSASVRLGLIFLRDRGIFVLWGLLILGFASGAHRTSHREQRQLLIANAAALTAIFAGGVAVGIICGVLDLSIPGVAALPACVSAG